MSRRAATRMAGGALATLLGPAVILLAGCGGGQAPSLAVDTPTVTITATATLTATPEATSTPAGPGQRPSPANGGGSQRFEVLSTATVEGTFPLQMRLTSSVMADGGTMPAKFTCDGESVSPPLDWSNAPAETQAYAVVMDDKPGQQPGYKWSWLLWNIPASASHLDTGSSGVGTAGGNSTGKLGYAPPCSQGPGPKQYTFTVYALSAPLVLSTEPLRVDRDILFGALAGHVLDRASLTVTYSRP